MLSRVSVEVFHVVTSAHDSGDDEDGRNQGVGHDGRNEACRRDDDEGEDCHEATPWRVLSDPVNVPCLCREIQDGTSTGQGCQREAAVMGRFADDDLIGHCERDEAQRKDHLHGDGACPGLGRIIVLSRVGFQNDLDVPDVEPPQGEEGDDGSGGGKEVE